MTRYQLSNSSILGIVARYKGETADTADRPATAYSSSRFVARIADSNRVESTDSCLLFIVCCVGDGTLQRADHSYRGVVPCMCVCVCVFVCVCDLETSTIRRFMPQLECCVTETKTQEKIPFSYNRLHLIRGKR